MFQELFELPDNKFLIPVSLLINWLEKLESKDIDSILDSSIVDMFSSFVEENFNDPVNGSTYDFSKDENGFGFALALLSGIAKEL